MDTIELRAGSRRDGSAVYEEVPVEPLDGGRFRLLCSPGLVLGLAADDVFTVDPDRCPLVVSRGRNLAVQILFRGPVGVIEESIRAQLATVRGRIDGKTAKQLVLSIPVSAGFATVKRVLDAGVAVDPTTEWYYGNVYDPSDGVTPLDWWK